MKRITFEVSDDMYRKIDDATVHEGFMTRSEFLRFLVMDYSRKNKDASIGKIPNKDNKNDFTENKYEFGIPPDELEIIKEKARKLSESERQRLS